MAPRRPWTSEDDDLLRELVAKGTSIAKTAEAMNRSYSTVQAHAKELGLQFGGNAPLAAIATRKADARAERAQFRAELMDDLKRLKQQLWQPTTVYNFGGKDNTFEEAMLDQPPIADQLRLVQAISTGIATIEKLEKMDADQGVSDAAGMLDEIAKAIQKAADEQAELL